MGGSGRETIEDIILTDDRRGIASLRPLLPADYCKRAAELVMRSPGTALIATGFFVDSAGIPETDGPPGALAIGRALVSLGCRIYYVTDRFSGRLMRILTGEKKCVVTFPVSDERRSEKFAQDLLRRLAPSVLIAVERCGRTAEGSYVNIAGRDISHYNAKIDYLFSHHDATVGIGDGGNEIGMGNLASSIISTAGLTTKPCVTPTTSLIIAAVSNWGAYGLVAALSILARRDLLPEQKEEENVIRQMVSAGAVDGISGKKACTVDGFTVKDNSRIIGRLRRLIRDM